MSVKAVSWALDDVQGIHPTRKLVLIVMAEAAHSDGTASFVSQQTISEKTGISVRQVRNHIVELERDGLIKRGDQRHVHHIPANYRPTVWDMNLTATGRLESVLQGAALDLPPGRNSTSARKPTSGLGRKPTSGPGRKPSVTQGGNQGGSPLPTNQEPEEEPRAGGADEPLETCRICERGREHLTASGVCSDCFEPQPQTPAPPAGGGRAEWHRLKAELQRQREEREAQEREAEDRRRSFLGRDSTPAKTTGQRP